MKGIDQPLVFLTCLAAGIAAGVLYRLLGLWRKRQPTKLVDALCDVTFVAASGAMYFGALFVTDYGRVRLYTIVAFLGGFALLCALSRYLPQRVKRTKNAGKISSN